MRGKSKISWHLYLWAYLTSGVNELWQIDMISQPIQTLHHIGRYSYTKNGWQLKEATLHIVHVIMKTQKEKKILGTLVASESWLRHFLPMTNVWFQSLKTFSELWSWPVWNFVCERRMNCHVMNMVCLSQRSQAKFSKYYIHTAHITICLQACLTMVRHGTLLMLWFD